MVLLGLLACGDANEGSGGAGTTTTQDTATSATGAQTTQAGPTNASSASTGMPEPIPGLYAEYWTGYTDLAVSRVEPTLDVVWGAGGPDDDVGVDHFSARWTGFVTAPVSGTFTIATENDDGLRVVIGDETIIDDWRGHFVERNEGTVTLEAGKPTPIRVDYFEIDIEASVRLFWSADGLAEEIIPTSALTTTRAPSGRSPKPPYANPVVPFDCPDPGVVAIDDEPETTYAMVCTGGNFPIRTSKGLVFWKDSGSTVLTGGKPPWAANGGRNWAPEIHRVGNGFISYFTSVNGGNVLSIGAATADDPLGPYEDIGAPLVQNAAGVIDASFFEDDDGSRWLTYKIDGNAHGDPTPIFIRQLDPSGTKFADGSTQKQILVNTPSTWEGGVVEAQWLVKRDGTYYLFYSGNVYDHRYRTGVARASSLQGPYEKHGAPILTNNGRWVGPGHGSVVVAGGKDYFVYHAWTNAGNGTHLQSQGRQVLVDRIDWEGGWPKIGNGSPSTTPQAWPGE